jgi:hypothetical protein
MTSRLRAVTKSLLQVSLGTRMFRQLVCAIVNKHLRSFSRPFNQYDDVTVSASSDVVWDWLSAHRPFQGGQSYGLDGAFPHRLQPRLLHQYELKSRQWHQFLSLSNHQETDRVSYGSYSTGNGHSRIDKENYHQDDSASIHPFKRQCIRPSHSRSALAELSIQQSTRVGSRLPRHAASPPTPAVPQPLTFAPLSHSTLGHLDLVTVNLQYHIAICRHCGVGVLWDEQWDHHFSTLHKLPSATRKAIQSRSLIQDPDIIRNTQQLQERFQYPIYEAPIPHIPVYSDGLGCEEKQEDGEPCRYICRTESGIKQHYRKEHGWQNPQSRGGSQAQRRNIARPWRKDVLCQRLFHNGPRNGYYEVQCL